MLSVSKLLCGTTTPGDVLRYGETSLPPHLLHFSRAKRPIVVWNITRRCNLHCLHCYASAQDREFPGELTTEEGKAFIDALVEYRVPVLLFSGGEPLTREDVFELGSYAASKGMRTVLSTNGTLITKDTARRIKEAGFSYVGVSLDGLEETHDRFRGKAGAFREALLGLHRCQEKGVRVGVRFTITSYNYHHINDIFRLIQEEDIPRLCFYHLVYSGRGSNLMEKALPLDKAREGVDLIFSRTEELHRLGLEKDVLTVDNHSDGVYLYLKIQEGEPRRSGEVFELLSWNGGNGAGIAIGAVDNLGYVHPDQFWSHYSLGNIRERKFGDIWEDTSDPLMAGLKERKPLLKGRCGRCRYLPLCNGNLRVRAEAVYGDVWAPDPACYLTDEEIGLDGSQSTP